MNKKVGGEVRPFRTRVLIYVNQIHSDDWTGQGSFERQLIAAFRAWVLQRERTAFRLVTVRRLGQRRHPRDTGSDAVAVPLDKTSNLSYLAHQIVLFLALLRELVRCRKDDVAIYARYSVSSVAPAIVAALFRRRLVVRASPVLDTLRLYGKRPAPLLYLGMWLGFWLNCRTAASIIVPTHQMRRYMEKRYPVVRGKLRVVPNGVSLDRMPVCTRNRERWGLAEEIPALGFVGHLNASQGLQTVIHALGTIQRSAGTVPQLLVVGDGPCRDEWKGLAHQFELDSSVVFAGQRPHADIASAIAACDLMVLPCTRDTLSTTGSSSMKLFEYLAANRPILASRCEDHQFLADRGLGWLLEPDDVNDWAAAIRDKTAGDLRDLGGRGRRVAEEEFSFARVAKSIWAACFDDNANEMAKPRKRSNVG